MQTSFRETYSLLKNGWIVNAKFDKLNGDSTLTSKPLNINNLVRLEDDLNCYVADDNKSVILKVDESLGRFKEVVFHRFYIIYEACTYKLGPKTFTTYLPKIQNPMHIYLCCNQLANSSKIALINNDDTYQSESVAYVNDNIIDCYFKLRVHHGNIVPLNKLFDICVTEYFKQIVVLDNNFDIILEADDLRAEIIIKDFVIDVEWKL